MHVLLVFFCWPRASWRFFGPQCVKARFLHVITWRSVELNRKVTYNCLAWFSGIKDYDSKYAQTRVSSKKDAVKVMSTESLYSLVSYNCTRLSVYHWLFDGHEQWSSLVRFLAWWWNIDQTHARKNKNSSRAPLNPHSSWSLFLVGETWVTKTPAVTAWEKL